MILYGTALGILALLWGGFDYLFHTAGFIAAGDLSSNHANFEADCEKCHVTGEKLFGGDVTDFKCSVCHEKSGGAFGDYSFDAHYVYTSGDKSRIQTVGANHSSAEENCYSCHPDHNGRMAQITEVSDAKCLSCHDYGSFDDNHPEFSFLRNSQPDDSTLKFTHARHTKFALEALEKAGKNTFIEQACLSCHFPTEDGAGFQDINFDNNCGTCHMTSGAQSPTLAVAKAESKDPGVETLEMIQRRRGPGARWAFYINPAEFTAKARGAKIIKAPVYHADPWIMENLRTLRDKLYSNSELFDLIGVAGSVVNQDTPELTRRALAEIKEQIDQLRGRREPEIQADIVILDSLMEQLEGQIDDLSAVQIAALFGEDSLTYRTDLTAGDIASLEAFANKLTGGPNKLCQECHYVSGSAIVAVNANQRTLTRARFDHHAHFLEKGCLDCHNVIPILANSSVTKEQLTAIDRSATHNLPGMENCAECHSSSKVASSCVSCHNFHPNKDRRSNLQFFTTGITTGN